MFSLIACHLVVTCAEFSNFWIIRKYVGTYRHSSNNSLPWARSILAASSVQMHSSCKKRNNVVVHPMSTMRKEEKISSVFFKIFLLLVKTSSKNCQGKQHSIGGSGLKLQCCYRWWITIDPTDSGWKIESKRNPLFYKERQRPEFQVKVLGRCNLSFI